MHRTATDRSRNMEWVRRPGSPESAHDYVTDELPPWGLSWADNPPHWTLAGITPATIATTDKLRPDQAAEATSSAGRGTPRRTGWLPAPPRPAATPHKGREIRHPCM